MLSAQEFAGRCFPITTGSDFSVDFRARLWIVTTTAVGVTVKLPPVTQKFNPLGAKVFVIVNQGSNAFNLRDHELTDPNFSSLSIAVNRLAIVHSYMNPTFKWIAETRVWDPT